MNTEETIEQLSQHIHEVEHKNLDLIARLNELQLQYNISKGITCITEIDSPTETCPSINRDSSTKEFLFPENKSRHCKPLKEFPFPEMDGETPLLFDGRSLSSEEQDRFLEPIMATQRVQLLSLVDKYLDEKKRQVSIDDSELLEKKWKR